MRAWHAGQPGAAGARRIGLAMETSDGEREMILNQEPDPTPWLCIKSLLLTPFVPVEQLSSSADPAIIRIGFAGWRSAFAMLALI